MNYTGLVVKLDLAGRRFGRLTAVRPLPARTVSGGSAIYWECLCDCGNRTEVITASLTTARTVSCGCARYDMARIRGGANFRHGHRVTETPTYRIWAAMRARVNNPNLSGYANYGGRGIKCIPRWAHFENFLADMGERPAGMTLDRIDPDGDYEPLNCRWADRTVQANNRRTNRRIEFRGESRTIREWEAELGFKNGTLWIRLKSGWDVERALTEPVRYGRKKQ